MNIRKSDQSKNRWQGGYVEVEMAFAAPLLCLVLTGMIQFGMILFPQSNMNHLVRETSRRVTVGELTEENTVRLGQDSLASFVSGPRHWSNSEVTNLPPSGILITGNSRRLLNHTDYSDHPADLRLWLPALHMAVVRVILHNDESVDGLLSSLREAFPNAIVDLDAIVHSAASRLQWDPTSVIGWPPSGIMCNKRIKIGMIDGVADLNHAALKAAHITQRAFSSSARPGASAHGTAIASVLVGDRVDYNGLLPKAELFIGGIFHDDSKPANLLSLLRALDWLSESGVNVINMSVVTGENDVLSRALAAVAHKGVIISGAAGNGGAHSQPVYPAAHPDVIAVTAIDRSLTAYAHANRGNYIDFAAPGVDINIRVPEGSKLVSGTSFAVPFVTAMAAVLIANRPNRSVEKIRQELAGISIDLGPLGKDRIYGWGLPQASELSC